MSRALLLFASTLISLALVEAVVRIFDLGPEISPVYKENFTLSENRILQYELVPYSGDGEHRINSLGMRDRERSLAKPPGVTRIAVIGDSIAFGHKAIQTKTLSAFLEDFLNREAIGSQTLFEVLNFGVTGYGIEQAMESLRARALRFDPDIAIYLYCLNDPEPYSLEMHNLLAEATAAERGYVERTATANLRSYVLVRYLVESLTREGRQVGHEISWRRDPQFVAMRTGSYAEYYTGLHRREDSWGRVATGFADLAGISSREGMRSLVAIFPVLAALDSDALQGVHARLQVAAAEQSIAHLDLGHVFRAVPADLRRRVVADALHPTGKGNQLAALAILYELLESGWVPGAGTDHFARLGLGDDRVARFAQIVQQSVANR